MTAKKKKKMDIPQLYSQLEYGHIEKEKGNFAYVLTILVLSILVKMALVIFSTLSASTTQYQPTGRVANILD